MYIAWPIHVHTCTYVPRVYELQPAGAYINGVIDRIRKRQAREIIFAWHALDHELELEITIYRYQVRIMSPRSPASHKVTNS